MEEVVVASVAAYAATDIDDIVVLSLLFGAARSGRLPLRTWQIVAGQYAGIAALAGASALGAAGLLLVPDEVVGLLGLVPLGLGVWGLLRRDDEQRGVLPATGGALGVAALTVANGGDNIAVYVPFFATFGADEAVAVAIVFAAMTALWLLAAHRLGTHPRSVAAIERYGEVIVPLVLIALGLAILLHAFA